jgi:hypothetical protein
MALSVQRELIKRPHQKVLDFLWTRQQDGEKVQKRRLVAKDRISASFNKGGFLIIWHYWRPKPLQVLSNEQKRRPEGGTGYL